MIQRLFFFHLAVMALATPLWADSAAGKLLKKSDDWFQTNTAKQTLENILDWQTDQGDWPKNVDTTKPKSGQVAKEPQGTFDNSATTGELRVLARAFRVTGDETYRDAFNRGLDQILQAQYPNGGWPQCYPPGNKYPRHITFNDGTMIRLMEFLRDVSREKDFEFLTSAERCLIAKAVDRGVDCILKCQVIVDDAPTVWCAQHDEVTLVPTVARSYEHPSLSGGESAGILRFLMSIENPSPEIIRAVNAGVAWYEATKIEGQRYLKSKTGPALAKDDDAEPLWARFYEIETNRPMFSDRDGIIKYNLEEIGSERRGGYTWYGNWGESLLNSYAKWPHRR